MLRIRNTFLSVGALLVLSLCPHLQASSLSESFDDITTLPGSGWTLVNNSAPAGSTSWFQGNPSIFSSQSGASDSYIAGDFNAAAFGGNIDLWLITPLLTLNNGDSLSFYTRTESPQVAADDLQVLMSTDGANGIADFNITLLDINPTLNVNGYPGDWTNFIVNVSGLGGPVTGSFAFRYTVTDTSVNGDYIGLDTVALDLPEPGSIGLCLIGFASLMTVARRRRNRA